MKKTTIIILTLVIALVFSACGSVTEFQCSAVVKINNSHDSSYQISLYDIDTYKKLFKSNTAITKIANNLDFEISNNELSHSIALQEINYTDTIEITASYKDENQAKQILNTLLKQYPLILKEYSSNLNFIVVSKSTDDSE